MTYFKAWVYTKDFSHNNTLYFKVEDPSEENIKKMYESLGWYYKKYPTRISEAHFVLACLRHPIRNHLNCFDYHTPTVVIR